MSNKTEKVPMVLQEERQNSEPSTIGISVEQFEIDNRKDSWYTNFRFTNRNEAIANNVRTLSKCCFEDYSSELELMEQLKRLFKVFEGDCRLNQHLI